MQNSIKTSQDKEYKYVSIIVPSHAYKYKHCDKPLKKQYKQLEEKFGKKAIISLTIANNFSELQEKDLTLSDLVIFMGLGNPSFIKNLEGLDTTNKNLKLKIKPGSTIVLSSSYTGSMEPTKAFQGVCLDGISKKPSEGLQKNIAYALARDNPGVEVIAPCGYVSGVTYAKYNKETHHQKLGVRFFSDKQLIDGIKNNRNYIKIIRTDPKDKPLEFDVKIRDIKDEGKKHKWTVYISPDQQSFAAYRNYNLTPHR
jgi:hypothetical protein